MNDAELLATIFFIVFFIFVVVWMAIKLGEKKQPKFTPPHYLDGDEYDNHFDDDVNPLDDYPEDDIENPYTNCGSSEELSSDDGHTPSGIIRNIHNDPDNNKEEQ